MTNQATFYRILFFLALVGGLMSCEEGPVDNPCEIDFDQEELFSDLTEEVIIPQWDSMRTAFQTMDESAVPFVDSPTLERFDLLRDNYLNAYRRWQRVRVFSFGPAEETMLVERMNSFPVEVDRLESLLGADSVDFTHPDNKFAQGFPALDYLLFGLENSASSIVMRFRDDKDLRDYLSANLEFMEDQLEQVWIAWSGDYPQAFINNTGTSEGSALSLLINHINLRYEEMRRNKLGIPSGIAALGIERPEKVEAYHSEYSLELLKSSVRGIHQAFTSGNGLGLDDYLEAAGAKTSTGEELDDVISEQFETAIEDIDQIPPSLATSIEGEDESIEVAYQALARQTVYLKTDLPAALCVSITYVDNPSDSD